jgi:biopolymer transport protein ExbD
MRQTPHRANQLICGIDDTPFVSVFLANSVVKYGTIKEVLDATRDAGVQKVSFLVDAR